MIDASDFRNAHASSSCCGAAILDPDLCEECGEHCEDLNSQDYDPTPWCAVCNAKLSKDCHCPPHPKDD